MFSGGFLGPLGHSISFFKIPFQGHFQGRFQAIFIAIELRPWLLWNGPTLVWALLSPVNRVQGKHLSFREGRGEQEAQKPPTHV